jgi:hypothetical protein
LLAVIPQKGKTVETEKKNKRGYYFWLDPELDRQIDSHLYASNMKSRSKFVNEAVKKYICELDSETNKEYLSEELLKAIRFAVRNSENHIASAIYKLAGEQATLNLVIADRVFDGLDDTAIRAYTDAGYESVRRHHGVFTFNDAIEDAKTVAEGADD